MKGLVLLLAAAALVIARKTDYCYSDISDPYLYFSSKTAYEFIHPNNPSPENLPHCEPVQLWFLGRHGTRYPSAGNIAELRNLTTLRDLIVRNHETGAKEGRLCDKDLESLKSWTFNLTVDDDNKLTPQGEEDLQFLARRLKQLFPSLLSTPYKSDLYHFRSTDTQRTKASAENFAKGLFGSSSGIYIPPPLAEDYLLKPYHNCTAWEVLVRDNPNAVIEATKFQEGELMTSLIEDVSSRLGFRYKLKNNQIFSMYDMCRYDKAWQVTQRSPWCAVFTKDQLKILEYSEDLHYYYKDGFGHQINIDLGCPLIKDLIERFSELEGENVVRGQHPVGVFYFSHSSMIHMFQSALGVYKDQECLRSDNYQDMQKRLWRVSKMGSFATNIEAVFFKCSEGEENRVMFYQSEKPMPMVDCKVGLCSWTELKKKFSSVAEGCNLEFCEVYSGSSRSVNLPWFSLLLIGALSLVLSWSR
ncbi:multiple inositol polyphosphate phosphatase 1 [Anabrus simplex]|uniref:multiple inositol polyphosphate phosphatase 1 n=1 Tax=Anabrus simplex TaxID=316456 RepID=UPI0035A38B94